MTHTPPHRSQLLLVPFNLRHRGKNGELAPSTSPVQFPVPDHGIFDPGRAGDLVRGTLATLIIDIEAPAEGFAVRVNADGVVGTHGCHLRSSYRPCCHTSWSDQNPSLGRRILYQFCVSKGMVWAASDEPTFLPQPEQYWRQIIVSLWQNDAISELTLLPGPDPQI